MSFEAWLTDRATIKRRSGSAVDAHGQSSGNYAAVASDVPCKIIHRDGRKVGAGGGEMRSVLANVSIRVSTVTFLPGVDVREQDQVVIDGVTYRVGEKGLIPVGNHHLDVAVETVRP